MATAIGDNNDAPCPDEYGFTAAEVDAVVFWAVTDSAGMPANKATPRTKTR